MSKTSDLLDYDIPVTRIIEDESVEDIRDIEDERLLDHLDDILRVSPGVPRDRELTSRFTIPMFKVEPQLFYVSRRLGMRNHIDRSRKVTINREKLVLKLKENRAKHAEIYADAIEGYRTEMADFIEMAGINLAQMHIDLMNAEKVEEVKPHSTLKDLPSFPSNALDSYDEAIELFEWDEAPTTELGIDEFRSYVLDKWDWQESFLGHTRRFSKAAAARSEELYGD